MRAGIRLYSFGSATRLEIERRMTMGSTELPCQGRSATFRALALIVAVSPLLWLPAPVLCQSLGQVEAKKAETAQESALKDTSNDNVETPGAASSQQPGARDTAAGISLPSARPPPLDAKLPPLDAPLDPDHYVCGPGDLLELNFWGLQNITLRLTIDLEGRLFVPKVGYLALGGKTLTAVRKQVKEAVGRYYPRLELDLAVAEPRRFLVQVVDAVEKPGSYEARATDRVATVIQRAGGLAKRASKREVQIKRRDGTTVQADLLEFAQTGDVSTNPFVLDGDVVRVPFVQVAATIQGAVNRPGRYELKGRRDLAALVDLAGGLSPSASLTLPWHVVRRGADDLQTQLKLDLSGGESIPALEIQHEDAVQVPALTDAQLNVVVMGALANVTGPTDKDAVRRIPFAQGDSVRTMLERLGGVSPQADLSRAYILRGGAAVPVDLDALVMRRNLGADRPLELGDTVVVPFKRRDVLIEGAVFAPGPYPFNPNFGIDQYLALAGGRNRFAKEIGDVRVISPQGEMKMYAPDLRIEPGASLVVPERDFSRAEVVQIIISGASILLSGMTLWVTLRK